MKQMLVGFLITLTASVLVGFVHTTRAVDDSPIVLSEDQIQSIEDRCLASEVALNKLHSNDGLLRVNLGQQYENLSLRLMAPLNSRLTLNSYDSVDLVQTTVDFNQALDKFRSLYRSYELSVDAALDIDCQRQPVEYYAAIELARERRANLYEATQDVNQLVKQYLERFDEFASKISDKGAE